MSYHCGVGPGLEKTLGVAPCEPHIACDGCGAERPVTKNHGAPYAWFLDGKAAPGWTSVQRPGFAREDWCPTCRPRKKGGGR